MEKKFKRYKKFFGNFTLPPLSQYFRLLNLLNCLTRQDSALHLLAHSTSFSEPTIAFEILNDFSTMSLEICNQAVDTHFAVSDTGDFLKLPPAVRGKSVRENHSPFILYIIVLKRLINREIQGL